MVETIEKRKEKNATRQKNLRMQSAAETLSDNESKLTFFLTNSTRTGQYFTLN